MKISTPRVVIAGAGGGKTHQMILEIIKIIPDLRANPEKFCAVVTYTNSATEEIKQRVSMIFSIPSNLHISTTHSFLTKFVIDPYAHLFGFSPIDKNYIDKIILPYKAKNQFVQKAVCVKKATELSTEKGLIIYDKILETSFNLLNTGQVSGLVANRLAYVFVDEYQDMRVYQHQIFQMIVAQGKTNFYCIGDPLQSIYNFTYIQSQLSKEPRPKCFKETPILHLTTDKNFITEKISVNNRCSGNIINFLNNYCNVISYDQTLPTNKICNGIPVYFIIGDTKNDILAKFDELRIKHDIKKELNKMQCLLIAENWSMFDDIGKIARINSEPSSLSLFKECCRVVLSSLGLNYSTLSELTNIKAKVDQRIQFREFCFSILKDIRNPNLSVDKNYICQKFSKVFKMSLPDVNKNIDVTDGIKKLKAIVKHEDVDKYCSSIHTSKGLEATSVLVIANTNKQFAKWLNFSSVIHDTDDDFRLGYVAFSRARELLCISSLEKPSKSIVDLLTKLNVKIIQ